FREFSIALPDTSLGGNADEDARRVLDAIRRGHVYSTIDALAAPGSLRMTAISGSRVASMGDTLPISGPVHIHVDAQAPADATVTLLRNGGAVASARGARLDQDAAAEAGVYRVEISLPGGPGTPPVPWMLGNPIYVGRADELPATALRNPPRTSTTLYDGG